MFKMFRSGQKILVIAGTVLALLPSVSFASRGQGVKPDCPNQVSARNLFENTAPRSLSSSSSVSSPTSIKRDGKK